MRRSIMRLLTLEGVILASLVALSPAALPDAGAGTQRGPADDAETATSGQAPEDYSASVRWFFLSLTKDIPSHRLADYLATSVADEVDAEVATEGDHISRDFPAGAWLATATGADRLHSRIRQYANRIGTLPSPPDSGSGSFPVSVSARILELVNRGDGVRCRLQLRLRADDSDTGRLETEFTSLGGAAGMHVFAAAIPDTIIARTSQDGTASSNYLVLTVNVRGKGGSQEPKVSQNDLP